MSSSRTSSPWLLHVGGPALDGFATLTQLEAFAAAYVAPWCDYTASYFDGTAW